MKMQWSVVVAALFVLVAGCATKQEKMAHSSEFISDIDPDIRLENVFQNDCTTQALTSNKFGRISQCISLFYVSSRQSERGEGIFGIADTPQYGTVDVRVPFKMPVKYEPQKCEQATTAWGLITIKSPICFTDENDTRYMPSEFEIVDQEEYFAYRKEIRQKQEKSDWVGLTQIKTVGERDSKKARSDYFFSELDQASKSTDSAVLIYIHGYNTTFEAAAQTLAHLTADLAFEENQYIAAQRNLQFGTPVLYTWPAPKIYKDLSAGARTVIDYVEGQLTADVASKDFRSLLTEIASSTSVREINIISTSMGARLIAQSINVIGSDFVNREGDSITVRLILAGADVGQRDFYKKLDEISTFGATDSNSNIASYFSNTDFALFLSGSLNTNKSADLTYRFLIESTDEEFERAMVQYKHNYRDSNVIDRVWYEYFGENTIQRLRHLRSLAKRTGVEAIEFTNEDTCRVGGYFLRLDGNSSTKCRPFLPQKDYFFSIEASGFSPQLGHGYFAVSPAVIADISCQLRDILPSPLSGERSIKRNFYSEGFFPQRKKYFLSLNENAPSSSACTSKGVKYIVQRRPREEETVIVYFELQDATSTSTVPVPFGEKSHDATEYLEDFLGQFVPGQIESIEVRAFTDASGDELRNEKLSSERANLIKRILTDYGVPDSKISALGLGEVQPKFPRGNKSVWGSALREPTHRKAEISVRYLGSRLEN